MRTSVISSRAPCRDETPPEREMIDGFAATLDARMRRRNERLQEHLLAWAELLDGAGWCVALRVDADGCWTGKRAQQFLAEKSATAPTWSELARVLDKESSVSVEWSERVAIWHENQDKTPLPEASLTRRESEVMAWLRQGKTSPETAVILGLSHRTVEKHVSNIYRKTGVSNRSAAILNRGYRP